MRFHNYLTEQDIRKDYDDKVSVDGGVLYRKGKIVQVWWVKDSSGKKINKKETWTSPDEKQAKEEFKDMKERFK